MGNGLEFDVPRVGLLRQGWLVQPHWPEVVVMVAGALI